MTEPSGQQIVDGITPAAPPKAPEASKPPAGQELTPVVRKRLKHIVFTLFAIPYLAYCAWAAFLLIALPDPSGALDLLVPIGSGSALLGAVILIGIGLVSLLRIKDVKGVPLARKRLAFIKLFVVLTPGIILSALVPMFITREPPLTLEVNAPADLVAPVTVEFSAVQAMATLAKRGMSAEKFIWDFEGDNEMNEQTLEPTVTAYYEKQGSYLVSVTAFLKDGTSRKITRRFAIPRAVFSVSPTTPVMDEPTRFSIAHIVEKAELEKAQWDFDGNGEIDETTAETDTVHTFFSEGPYPVRVIVLLKNQTQRTYEREIEVLESLPLPFPVKIVTEPELLLSPPPFGTVFSVETEEPLKVVLWKFGDGGEARGERVAHNYTERGVFAAQAEVRSMKGEVAKISKIVRVVERLTLSDLKFEGTPEVRGSTITGEVPVIVSLRPKTSMPLINFRWEAPEATSFTVEGDRIDAAYRREGSYVLTLVGEDPDQKVLRMPITVEVLPQKTSVSILMNPEGGTAPLTVKFDASESVIPNEQISGFEWTFSDERSGPIQQGAQVEHVFKRPGTYTVKVKVLTTSGKEYTAEKTIVVRTPVIDACISASRTEGKAPLGVQFFSTCSVIGGATTYEWDFGDEWTSDIADPVHSFTEPGTYQVTLTIRDGQNVSISEPLSITAYP